MSGKGGDELCYRWIVEYNCWRMWTKFSVSGSVDGFPNRASPRDAPNPNDHGDDKACQYHLLVFFMCKISQAAKEESLDGAVQHDDTSQQTTLEDAIDRFDDISRCWREIIESSELKDVKLCLRRHAVLAPLRRSDRTLAKVYSVLINVNLYF